MRSPLGVTWITPTSHGTLGKFSVCRTDGTRTNRMPSRLPILPMTAEKGSFRFKTRTTRVLGKKRSNFAKGSGEPSRKAAYAKLPSPWQATRISSPCQTGKRRASQSPPTAIIPSDSIKKVA